MCTVVTQMVEILTARGSTEFASLGSKAWFSKFIPGYKQHFINYVSIHLTAVAGTPSGGIANVITAWFLDALSRVQTKVYRGMEADTTDSWDSILFHKWLISFIPSVPITCFEIFHATMFKSNLNSTATVKRHRIMGLHI